MKKRILLLLFPLSLYSQKYRLPLKFSDFRRWSYEVKEQKRFYKNDNLKSKGHFRLYTINDKKEKLAIPINRHVFYRKNGRLRRVMNYSDDGIHQTDSIYRRNGELKRVYVYK